MSTSVNQTPPAVAAQAGRRAARTPKSSARAKAAYPLWFHAPAGLVFLVFFLVPTAVSFYFSLTRWTLFDSEFIGLDNFTNFLHEPALTKGLTNTLIFAVVTCGLKVVLGMAIAVLLTRPLIARGYLRSVVFFPVLVSAVGVGLTFQVLMDPEEGTINQALGLVGLSGPGWLTDPHWALLSVALVDVWKGLGLAVVIYIAGITAIPQEYYEAAEHGRRRRLGNLPPHHPAAVLSRDLDGHPAVTDRRAQVVRPHLGHDRRRSRLHL